MKKRWIQLGIVGKAHGLNGAFFISDRDEVLPPQLKQIAVGPSPEKARLLSVSSCRMQSGRPLLQCVELSNRDAAEALLLQIIWGERERVPVDESREYLWADVVGKDVHDRDGVLLGRIEQIGNFGASDIVRIVNAANMVLDLPLVSVYFDMSFTSLDSSLRLVVPLSTFDESWSPA